MKEIFLTGDSPPVQKNHLQTTVIKKQKEAAMSAEYAEGGFTPDGPKKKVVGVVHAGGMGSESEVGEVAGGSASTRGARGCAEAQCDWHIAVACATG